MDYPLRKLGKDAEIPLLLKPEEALLSPEAVLKTFAQEPIVPVARKIANRSANYSPHEPENARSDLADLKIHTVG